MLKLTPQTLETMADATERALFEDDVKIACLKLMKTISEGEVEMERLSLHLFEICSEVASSTASHIAMALFDAQELDRVMAEVKEQTYDEMEKELQKILADFAE